MARTKTTTDREIVEAAARVIARVGPSCLRLADVATEVGLAPATLLQRFKTKRDLLLAVTELRRQEIVEDFAERRATVRSPVEALLSVKSKKHCFFNSRQQVANSLASIQLSLTDPGFHEQMHLLADTVRVELASLIDEAIRVGELYPCDADRLARTLMAVFHGSLIWWAVGEEGPVEAYIERDIEMLVAPYRTGHVHDGPLAAAPAAATSPAPVRAASERLWEHPKPAR